MEDNTRYSCSTQEKQIRTPETPADENLLSPTHLAFPISLTIDKKGEKGSIENKTKKSDTDSQQREMGEEVEKLERVRHVEEEVLQWIAQKPDHHFSFPIRGRHSRGFLRGNHGPLLHLPSFIRRQRTPEETIELRVGATITNQSVPGQNIVLVRPRTLGQTNPKEHNGLVPMEGDEEIFEEKAVCKVCFDILKEENILKTECKCGIALIHEECAANWLRMRGNNNCDSCGQEVQTFPVTLVRGLSSSTQVIDREESNKCFGCFHG